jgi:anti-sigma factor RsiW
MLGGGIGEPAGVVPAVAPTGAAGPVPDLAGAIPQLVVAQAVAPVATASGVTAKELQQYLLAQPGISEQLANAVRALGDPTTTWPIPVPLGALNTHTVSVQGVRGTVFADTSGFVVGVMWLKGGIVYAVGAPLSEQEVLRVANSLR